MTEQSEIDVKAAQGHITARDLHINHVWCSTCNCHIEGSTAEVEHDDDMLILVLIAYH